MNGPETSTPAPRRPGVVCACPEGVKQKARLAGFVDPVAGLDCERPLALYHACCDSSSVIACRSHRQDRCIPCSWRYRRLVGRIAGHETPAGFVYLLTLTAPGDQAHNLPNGDPCACTPAGGVELRTWNPSAGKRWHGFVKDLRRGSTWTTAASVEFFRGVEVQKRGALHLHVIVRSDVALDPAGLRRLAIHHGFGHSLRLDPLREGQRHAGTYVAKYVTKATTERESVPWLVEVIDQETGEILESRRPTFRTWSASAGWGLTMRAILEVLRAAAASSDPSGIRRAPTVAPPASPLFLGPAPPEPAD